MDILSKEFYPVVDEIEFLGIYKPRYSGDFFVEKVKQLKKRNELAIEFFFEELNDIIGDEIAIVTVPSHSSENILSGITLLGKKLASVRNRFDCTDVLERKTTIGKLSGGAPRSEEIHLKSIALKHREKIDGKYVLLLDDVITTGGSMNACKHILLESAKPKFVQCYSLSRTEWI